MRKPTVIHTLPALLLATLLPLAMAACHGKVGDDVVARAYGNYLRVGDLKDLVAPGLPPEDSIAIVDNYIDQWMQQQVVLHKAEKNVDDDFQQQLQLYKDNLITYEYERLMIAQLLDTTVTNEEIAAYYKAHHDDFLLKTNILRAIYIKVDKAAPCLPRLRKLMNRGALDDAAYQEVQEMAATYGQDYNLDEETWMPFQKLQAVMPLDAYNEVAFLRDHKVVSASDDKSICFVNILEYKTVDEVSPLEYERGHIRTVLLNSRKIDIIKNMQRDLMAKAEQDKDIERYR